MRDPSVMTATRGVSLILDGNRKTLRATENVRELLAGLTDRRRVHERERLAHVRDNERVVQVLIALAQVGEFEMLLKRRALGVQLVVDALHLLLNRLHLWRQQSTQVKPVTLLLGEARACVSALPTIRTKVGELVTQSGCTTGALRKGIVHRVVVSIRVNLSG